MNSPPSSAPTSSLGSAPDSLLEGGTKELSVDAVRAAIAAAIQPLTGVEALNIRSALGRVLAQAILSPLDVPGHDNSAMDGYALRHADLTAGDSNRLRIAGSAFAGRPYAGPELASATCVRVMTGALLPAGADCVVPQEITRADGEYVLIPPRQRQFQNIRRAGEDVIRGATLLSAGQLLRPAEIGMLASVGIAEVEVRRRPRVAFFSTGDELCSIGSTPARGQVFDSNRYTVDAMLRRLGCEPLDFGVVPDHPEHLQATLVEAAAGADVIITTGGVSVGDADFIRSLVARLGQVVSWRIAMKPGRPMAFGRIGDAVLFGLPGNPVAVMVTFYAFVREALLRMMGASRSTLPLPRLPCATALKKSPGRTEYQRGIVFDDANGLPQVRLTGAQGSGILHSMSEANCFIVLPPELGDVAPGDLVSVQLFDGLV